MCSKTKAKKFSGNDLIVLLLYVIWTTKGNKLISKIKLKEKLISGLIKKKNGINKGKEDVRWKKRVEEYFEIWDGTKTLIVEVVQ